MDTVWYVALSAVIFSIGAGGLLARRSPLVMLLCLELMLNASNLALIAFARMWANVDGQIFALVVMVVAACEVVVGLGIIVALYRNRVAIDIDELDSLRDPREGAVSD
ncbi:MAG: NADH-quinone oxidoreductase subunit NuoK [Solirubrobacterales bacterium]